MALGKGLHMEKRHVFVRAISPRGLVGRLVPRLFHVHKEIIVRFSVVRAVVTSFLEVGSPRLQAFRQIGQGGLSMVLKTAPWSEYPGGQGGTGDRANGSIREGVVEGQALGRQLLYVRHGPKLGAIMAQVMNGIVLRDQEYDVGTLGGMDQDGEKKIANSEKSEGEFHGDEVLMR